MYFSTMDDQPYDIAGAILIDTEHRIADTYIAGVGSVRWSIIDSNISLVPDSKTVGRALVVMRWNEFVSVIQVTDNFIEQQISYGDNVEKIVRIKNKYVGSKLRPNENEQLKRKALELLGRPQQGIKN